MLEFIDSHYNSLQYLHPKTLKRMMTYEPKVLLYVHTDHRSTETIKFKIASQKLKLELLCVSSPITLHKHVKKLMRFLGVITPYTEYTWDNEKSGIEGMTNKENPEKNKS
jgi:hypothetical protein